MGRKPVNGNSVSAATLWKKATEQRLSLKLIILAVLLLPGIFLVWIGATGELAKLLNSAHLFSWVNTFQKEARAERMVRDAWQRITQAGQYDFSTTVEQITYPAPMMSNVGSSSTRDVYHISGRADLEQRKLTVSLWQNAGSLMNTQDGLEIRIEDGQAWGRAISGEWQKIDSFSASSFAPGNDAASFLASARNVHLKEYVALNLSPVEGKTLQLKSAHYTFELDANRMAAYMRDQMVAELQRAGKLPAGMHLELSSEYRKMTGNGEVWIGADGLPLRMTMNMKFPPAKSGERIEARLNTEFFVQQPETQQAASFYLLGWLSGAGRKMAFSLMAWLSSSGSSSSDMIVLALCMGLVLCFAGLLLFTQRDLNNSTVYRLVACLVILCTLVSPLWEGAKAQEYSRYTQSESQKQSDRQQQATKERQTINDFYGMDWNPQASPYSQVDPPIGLDDQPVEYKDILSPIADRTASPLADDTGDSEADSDIDGLTDTFENRFEISVLNPNDPDTDDDGLTDGEEFKLGLLPGKADSDNDGILDLDEVQNWYGYDQYWWSDPNSRDTDKDGILDGVECPERVPPKPSDPTWSPGICRDTDQDKNPDIFDQDDDGDGVPSIVDASAVGYDSQIYSQTNPFKMSVSNLATDDIFLTYQLKPTNPEHLTYSMNVLDWPSGDTDGQIMRISETTFMDQLAPEKRAGDPKADKGDLRLIPMLEIRLTGSSLPLQLTNMLTVPITSTPGSSVSFGGAFRLTAQSGSSQVLLVDAPAGVYPVYHGKGTCDDISSATYIADLTEGGSATVTGISLGAFAQGDRVLYVTNAARTDVIACTVVTSTAHGSLIDQVVDSTLLSSYGVSARNDADNSVLLYSPLSMVYDYAGGTPTAFQTKIPFSNTDGRMNGSHQEVRAVWLLDMITDVCKPRPEGFTGEWCISSDPSHWYTDQSRIVQTYNEEFKLAGLNIQEDYGLDMAVVFEDPAIDPDPQYDDPLWGLSHGLESSFIAGRDSDDDGVRDIKVSDLAGRFDGGLNGCPAPDPTSSTYPYVFRENNYSDWGLPCNAFKVLNYQYEFSDGVHEFMQGQAQQVFADYFPSPGATPSYVNLLFAREMSFRTVAFGDEAVTCSTGECAFDFSGQDLVTQAVMNWSPYKWDGSEWSSYPLDDYLDVLESNLRVLDAYKPEDESLDAKHIVDGQIYMARLYYEGISRGVAQLVALNGNPVINIPQELRDDYIYDSFYRANGKAQVVTKVVSTLVEVFLRGVEQSPIWIDIFYGATRLERATAFFKTVGLGLGDKLSPITSKITSLFRKVAVAIVIVLIVAIIVASLIMYLTGPDSKVGKLGARILFTTIGLITMVIGIGGAAGAIMNIGKAVSNAAKGAAIVGAIIAGIITWGVFIYSAIASGAGAFSLAMNSLFADAVAATCTIVLMTALACTGVGAIIVGIIAAIDGLITAICYAAGAYEQEESHWARQYVCIGISGWVTKIFKWILYSATYMVDYDNGARLEFTGLDQSLQDWTKGMVPENPMSYTLGVTNYITLSDIPIDWKAAVFFWQYSHSTAKSSTFVYKMQPAETDIHDGLERGTISDVWQDTGRNHVWSGNFEARTDGFSIAMPAPGINRAPVAYFSEGSAVPVQECLGIPVPPLWYPIPICYIRTERATINSDLSSSLTVDVFPKTLDDFYDLVEVTTGGYSFAWGRDTEPTFPTFKDADGDGLTSPALGGNDPDDSRFDTDNDGLTDYYETMQGLNPRLFDTDDDGLNDGQEVDLSTDPLRKDSDGDGLPDTEELQGWLFTYAFEADGTPRETKVYSDPLMPDTDFDSVTDLQEKIYGFNPNVSQAVNILDYQLSTRELDSPLVLLTFNEGSGASSFEDASHFGYNASCDLLNSPDACPTSGVEGRYSNAISLGGEDFLILSTSAKSISLVDNRPFTLAAWVFWEGGEGTLISKWNAATGNKQELRFGITGSGALSLVNSGGSSVSSSAAISPLTWTHAAVSFDGSQASFAIDGVASGGGAWSNTPSFPPDTEDSMVMVGAYRGASGVEGFFTGKLDEVSIVDRAFSTSEIAMRLTDARYNLNDGFLRPGEDFNYQSVIENLLNSRFAYGLLKTLFNPREAIADWMNKLLPRTFQLKPDNPVVTGVNTAVISDTLHIEDTWTQSGNLNIKQTVTAQIVDQRAESNFAALWLKFNEAAGATTFVDASGNMPPRDVECTSCPTSGEGGILNNSIKFGAGEDTPVSLPDLDTLDLIQRGYTVALWIKPAMPSSGSTVLTLLKSENDNFSLRIRKNSHDQYVPQVYVNGSDVTPGMEGLWRVLLPGVWNHLVVRYSSSDQRLGLYLNGAQVAVFTGVPAITSNDNFYLGGTTQSVDYWVDDLRLFNRPISVLDLNRLAERTVLQMQMDGSGFPDSSVYNQTVTQRNTPHQIGGSVRGSSLQAGSGSSLGYLKVNGNDLLNMQDGAFSFAAWIYPTSGGTGNDWEGIFGYESGTSTAYPVLERKGARLRFGFGDGSSFVSKEVTADVLNLNQWNHVVVNFQPEFDLNGVSTGNYLYKLYVDSTAVDSNIFTTKPHADSGKTLFVGHSSKSMTVTVNDLYVDGIRGDAGDWAEVWMERYVDGGFQNCFWPTTDCDDEQDVQGTNTYSVNYSTSYADYQSVRIEVWEDDWGANPNDHAGDANYYWYDLPGYDSWYMSDGISGYLHTTLSRPSTQFFGYIDELEVYRYGLDSEQVFDLYNAIPITARLPLDDRPASDSFDNRAFIGELDNGVCTEPACPAAGTVGLINQDVTFDGADDLITVPMVSTTPDYMVSLWLLSSCSNCGVYTLEDAAYTTLSQIYLKNGNVCVKTGATEMCTQGNGFTNEQWHHVVYANNGSVANLWLDGSVVNTISGGATLPSSPGGFVRLGYAPEASQDYLYGQLDDVRVFRYSQDAAMVALLKRQAPLALFHLDEETAASGFEDATPADWMLDCAGACPQTYLPGRLGHTVEFSGTQQLALRQDLLSGTTKSFSAGVWVYPTRVVEQPQTLWVLGNALNSAPRYSLAMASNSLKLCLLRATGNGACAEDTEVGLIQNVWNHVTLTVEQPIPPTPSTVVTETVRLYINGYQDSVYSGNSGTVADLSGLGRLWIGDKPAAFSGLAGGAFGGRIDEVTLFEDVLTEIDVRDMFRYQMSQVEEFDSINLTIDAEPPTAELVSYNPAFPYLSGTDTQLQVDASDVTSGIGMVEMRVLYHGAPHEAYQVAPVCLDSTNGASFCPTFVSDAGDGTYELSFRAVDLVGHQAETQNYPVYVDNAGPQIDCDQQSAGVKVALLHPSKKHTWLLHLNGSIYDESLSDGVTGSGVYTNSVRVTLFSATGETIGLGAQIPTLTPSVLGYDWELDYLMPEVEPTGKLTVLIEGSDKIGNHGQRQFDLLLDATAPRGKLNNKNLPAPDLADLLTPPDQFTRDVTSVSSLDVAGAPLVVSTTEIHEADPVTILISGTLSGTISDIPTDEPPYITADGKAAVSGVNKVETAFLPEVDVSYLFNEPYPDELLAWLPLDQDEVPVDENGDPNPDATQRLFIDISPHQNAGDCQLPDCPIAGIEGHKMGTMYFSGTEQYINLANQVDLANRSFSVSIWAQRDQIDRNDPMLWQGPVSVASKRFLFGVNDQNRFVCGFGGSDLLSPLSYADTGWHHWACSFDQASGVRTIYRDGQALASDLASPLPAMYENLFIGLAPVGDFKGHLDELQIFGRALNASQVREQYTGYNMVYHLAVVENWYTDGDLVKDSSGYFQDGRLASSDPNNKVTAGKVGDFALHFDGNDRLEVPADLSTTSGYSLRLDRGAFTQAAWIYPEAGSGEGDILSQRDENPEMRYPSLLLTGDDRLKAGFGDFYNWHEIETPAGVITRGAWNFVTATFDGTKYRLYVNGGLALESDELSGLKPYASQAFNIGDGFSGELDDVRIFTRALDSLEIQALMGNDWRLAGLQGSGAEATWTNTLVSGLEGPYHIGVRGWDAQGHYDTSMLADDQWGGVVDTLAPRIQMVRTPDPAPTGTYTVTYSFSIEDTMLDEETILENMCAGDVSLNREYYNSSWYLAQGLPPNTRIFRVSGTCQGDTRTTSEVGVYACDLGGNCASATFPPFYDNTLFLPMVATSGAVARQAPVFKPIPPAVVPQGAQPLLERALTSPPDSLKPELSIATSSIGQPQVRNPVHILLKGAVWDDQQVAWVQVRILKGGQEVYTTRASLYGRVWNALWAFIPGQAPASGVYTVEVTASDLAGNLATISQGISVDFKP